MDFMHASMDLELVKKYLINRLLAFKQTSIISDALYWVLYRINVFLDAQKRGSDALCPQTIEMVLNLSWAC